MSTNSSGATDALTEIAGEATREAVKTDLQANDGTASGGDTVQPDAPPGTTLPPDDVDLPGPTYDLEDSSGKVAA